MMGGNVVIADYGIQPIICNLSHAEQGVAVYNIQDYTGCNGKW